jgi:hypothetical protein
MRRLGPEDAASSPAPATTDGSFSYLSRDRANLLVEELERIQAELKTVGSNAREATAAAVEVLKATENILREVCLANGMADGSGGVVVQKVKRGVTTTKKLHGMGAYLIECKAIKDHLSPQLHGRLHKIRESRNMFSHESGILCSASKGLEFCLLAFEVLEAVSHQAALLESKVIHPIRVEGGSVGKVPSQNGTPNWYICLSLLVLFLALATSYGTDCFFSPTPGGLENSKSANEALLIDTIHVGKDGTAEEEAERKEAKEREEREEGERKAKEEEETAVRERTCGGIAVFIGYVVCWFYYIRVRLSSSHYKNVAVQYALVVLVSLLTSLHWHLLLVPYLSLLCWYILLPLETGLCGIVGGMAVLIVCEPKMGTRALLADELFMPHLAHFCHIVFKVGARVMERGWWKGLAVPPAHEEAAGMVAAVSWWWTVLSVVLALTGVIFAAKREAAGRKKADDEERRAAAQRQRKKADEERKKVIEERKNLAAKADEERKKVIEERKNLAAKFSVGDEINTNHMPGQIMGEFDGACFNIKRDDGSEEKVRVEDIQVVENLQERAKRAATRLSTEKKTKKEEARKKLAGELCRSYNAAFHIERLPHVHPYINVCPAFVDAKYGVMGYYPAAMVLLEGENSIIVGVGTRWLGGDSVGTHVHVRWESGALEGTESKILMEDIRLLGSAEMSRRVDQYCNKLLRISDDETRVYWQHVLSGGLARGAK